MVSNIEQRQYTLNSFETHKDIYMYTTHAVQFSCDQIYNVRCTNKDVLLLVKINHSMYHMDSTIASFSKKTLQHGHVLDKKSMDVKSWEQHYVHDTAWDSDPIRNLWFLSPNHQNVHNVQFMFCTKNTSIRTFDISYETRMFCNEARNIIHDPKCYGYVNHDYRLHRGTLYDYLQANIPYPFDKSPVTKQPGAPSEVASRLPRLEATKSLLTDGRSWGYDALATASLPPRLSYHCKEDDVKLVISDDRYLS